MKYLLRTFTRSQVPTYGATLLLRVENSKDKHGTIHIFICYTAPEFFKSGGTNGG